MGKSESAKAGDAAVKSEPTAKEEFVTPPTPGTVDPVPEPVKPAGPKPRLPVGAVTVEGALRLAVGVNWNPARFGLGGVPADPAAPHVDPPKLDIIPGLVMVLGGDQRAVVVLTYGADGEDPMEPSDIGKLLTPRRNVETVGNMLKAGELMMIRTLKVAEKEGVDEVAKLLFEFGPGGSKRPGGKVGRDKSAMMVAMLEDMLRKEYPGANFRVDELGPLSVLSGMIPRAAGVNPGNNQQDVPAGSGCDCPSCTLRRKLQAEAARNQKAADDKAATPTPAPAPAPVPQPEVPTPSVPVA